MIRASLIGILLILTGCKEGLSTASVSNTGSTTVFTGSAMTMDFKVIIGESLDSGLAEKAERMILDTFETTDRIFNKWNANSELSTLNRLDAGVKVQLSPLLLRLFEETDAIVALTNGRFDPTIEPLQKIWKEKLANGTVPTKDELEDVAPVIGWKNIHFEGGQFTKDHSGTMFDFGGIAKGLCIDLIVERLISQGYTNLYVEWGGEIRANGIHPEGRPWRIFIARLNDDSPDHAVATLGLNNEAIATSGDYLQNWTVCTDDQGKCGQSQSTTYFHIFDPESSEPLRMRNGSVASASVVSSSCAFADGLATAAMMFPSVEDAEEWAQQIGQRFPGTRFWIVQRE